jgi:hypothetical protein
MRQAAPERGLKMAKKTKQNAIRLSSELFELGRKTMSRRGAETFLDCVRGLPLLDAADQSLELLFAHDFPARVTRDRRFEEVFSPTRNANHDGKNSTPRSPKSGPRRIE